MRLHIESEGLHNENEGLKLLVTEREKVAALVEQKPAVHEPFWKHWATQQVT